MGRTQGHPRCSPVRIFLPKLGGKGEPAGIRVGGKTTKKSSARFLWGFPLCFVLFPSLSSSSPAGESTRIPRGAAQTLPTGLGTGRQEPAGIKGGRADPRNPLDLQGSDPRYPLDLQGKAPGMGEPIPGNPWIYRVKYWVEDRILDNPWIHRDLISENLCIYRVEQQGWESRSQSIPGFMEMQYWRIPGFRGKGSRDGRFLRVLGQLHGLGLAAPPHPSSSLGLGSIHPCHSSTGIWLEPGTGAGRDTLEMPSSTLGLGSTNLHYSWTGMWLQGQAGTPWACPVY